MLIWFQRKTTQIYAPDLWNYRENLITNLPETTNVGRLL